MRCTLLLVVLVSPLAACQMGADDAGDFVAAERQKAPAETFARLLERTRAALRPDWVNAFRVTFDDGNPLPDIDYRDLNDAQLDLEFYENEVGLLNAEVKFDLQVLFNTRHQPTVAALRWDRDLDIAVRQSAYILSVEGNCIFLRIEAQSGKYLGEYSYCPTESTVTSLP